MYSDVGITSKVNAPERQERKLFPTDLPPDHLGYQMQREVAPHRGPGCYDHHKFASMMHDMMPLYDDTKMINKGYVRSLDVNKTVTPSPQKYQQDQPCSRILPPFNSSEARFIIKSVTTDSTPGPGTYSHEAVMSRKVAWPMSFGSPNWVKFPQLERKTVRAVLPCESDFKKQRARVAYLSLYY